MWYCVIQRLLQADCRAAFLRDDTWTCTDPDKLLPQKPLSFERLGSDAKVASWGPGVLEVGAHQGHCWLPRCISEPEARWALSGDWTRYPVSVAICSSYTITRAPSSPSRCAQQLEEAPSRPAPPMPSCPCPVSSRLLQNSAEPFAEAALTFVLSWVPFWVPRTFCKLWLWHLSHWLVSPVE